MGTYPGALVARADRLLWGDEIRSTEGASGSGASGHQMCQQSLG